MLLSLLSAALINSFHIHPPGSKLGNKLHSLLFKRNLFLFLFSEKYSQASAGNASLRIESIPPQKRPTVPQTGLNEQ